LSYILLQSAVESAVRGLGRGLKWRGLNSVRRSVQRPAQLFNQTSL